MARDKERSLNPAAAKLKQDKAQARAKATKERTKQRQEKLARRNPERIQKQIDLLIVAKERSSGHLPQHDAKQLDQLETELKAIRKAKDSVGDSRSDRTASSKPPSDQGRNQSRGIKIVSRHINSRTNDIEDPDDTDESTSSSVQDIPMPEGPPPMSSFQAGCQLPAHLTSLPSKPFSDANSTTATQIVTTYSSAPILRDLQKEAIAFVPAAIQRQRKTAQAIQKIRKEAEEAGIAKVYRDSKLEPAPEV